MYIGKLTPKKKKTEKQIEFIKPFKLEKYYEVYGPLSNSVQMVTLRSI